MTMKGSSAVVLLLVLVVGLVAVQAIKLPWFLNEPQPLGRNQNPPQQPLSFSWANCGASTDPTKLYSLSITPDPIVLGDNITIVADAYLSDSIIAGKGYSVSLEIYKSILGVYVFIPCIDNVGSCTIPDICAVIHPNDNCPLAKYNIPCSCPFNSGNYVISAPGLSVHLKDPHVSWLTDGDFKIQATLNDPSGNRLACYQLDASLSS